MGNIRDIVGALLVGLGIFMTWAWAVPGYQAASALNAVVEEKEAELVKKQEILEKIKNFINQSEARSEEIFRLSQVIPTTKSIQEVVAMIESAASVNGLRIISITATGGGTSNSGGSLDRVAFEVEFDGSYPALYGFMGTIEKYLRLLDIIAFDINPPTGESITTALNMKVKMEGYILKEAQQQTRINNEE